MRQMQLCGRRRQQLHQQRGLLPMRQQAQMLQVLRA